MNISKPLFGNLTRKPSLGFLPFLPNLAHHDTLEPDLFCTMEGTCTENAHTEGGSDSSTSTPQQPEKSPLNLDYIIDKILVFAKEGGVSDEKSPVVSLFEIGILCDLSTKVFLLQPSLLELNPADTGLTIIGDLHGHLLDLLTIFKKEGSPDIHNYLFLGNYIDTGRHQIELLCLLFCYKLKHPENFFLLRGAHESRETNKNNGFWHKCRSTYSETIWEAFNNSFDAMPFAAVLGDRIFCVHSGLSPNLQTLEQLRNIHRPTNIPKNGLLYDLLWAVPTVSTPGWNVSEEGTVMVFGKGVCRQFFRTNELEFMIRGHSSSERSYLISSEKKILSIFSSANFAERMNEASFAHVSVNLAIQVYIFDQKGKCQEKNLHKLNS